MKTTSRKTQTSSRLRKVSHKKASGISAPARVSSKEAAKSVVGTVATRIIGTVSTRSISSRSVVSTGTSKEKKKTVSSQNTSKPVSIVSQTRNRSVNQRLAKSISAKKKQSITVSKVQTPRRIKMSGQQEVRPEIDPPQENIEVSDSTNIAIHPAPSTGTSASRKKLKGALSIKFKSWNWDKQMRPSSQGMHTGETFDSSEGEEEDEEEPPAKNPANSGKIVVTQNNQTLQKCHECLLYIPLENFEKHETKDCEALRIEAGREYICSECLACYSSQKFLVRHKRECPKRNQNYTLNHSRYPKSVSSDLDSMYSVVWKCHCKKNFMSAEELGKHRQTCISAQQYTATCPICNARMMGGSRTLRYHMTQNHASLFMPDETNSSTVLSSLQGTSPVQVITTQTTNIGELVKKLSKEHTGANIRVVSVNPNQKSPQKRQNQLSPYHAQKPPTPRPTQPEATAAQHSEVVHRSMEIIVQENAAPAETLAADNRKRRSNRAKDEEEAEDEPNTAEPIQKKTRMSPRGKESNAEPDTPKQPITRAKVDPPKQPITRGKGNNPEIDTPKQPITRGKDSNTDVEMPKKPEMRRTVTRSKAVEAEMETPTNQPGGRGRSPKRKQTESPKPAEVKVQEVKANVRGKAKVKKAVESDKEEDMETKSGEADAAEETKNQEDLENLLVKAKALTKELEDKLASQSPKPAKLSIDDAELEKAQTTARDVKNEGKNESQSEPNVSTQIQDDTTELKSPNTGKPDDSAKKSRRRFAQVTCLDCQQVFKDYVDLGRHKRTDCPVVISQHLSADGNFTEKVALFQEGKPTKQQKLDVVECYYCTLCNSKFKLRSQVYEHMRFEHRNRGLGHYLNYHCPYCPRVFQTTKQRHEHKQERHNDIRLAPDDDFTIKETVVCSICYQVVPKWDKDKHDASECKKHVTEKESDTFCQLCGMLCQTQDQLKYHRQVEHLNAIHFRCGQCTRTFGHAVELRCHKVSHHTKNPRWEQNLSMLKAQEARRGSPGPRKVRIHISPSVEEVKNPGARPRIGSPIKINLPTKVETSKTANGNASQVAAGTTPRATAIRLPPGGGPLALTPQQMRNLSQGQPIKLVVTKNTDIKNLSFTVPGEDGKPKKFSVTAKAGEGRKISTNVKEDLAKFDNSAGTAAALAGDGASPQRELAAALGLQPKGPGEVVQAPTKHRPTRLRSGRTIDNKGGAATPKKDAEKYDKQKTETAQSEAKPAIKGKKTAKEQEEKADGTPQKTRTSARIEAKEDKQTDEKKNPAEKKTRKDANEDQELAEDGQVDSTEGRKSSRVGTKKSKDSKESQLAPVQVLKPVGKDSVECMRCNSVLHSMMEVASHQCNK